MATCGNCKALNQPVDHIRDCYAQRNGATSVREVTISNFARQFAEDFKPMAFGGY